MDLFITDRGNRRPHSTVDLLGLSGSYSLVFSGTLGRGLKGLRRDIVKVSRDLFTLVLLTTLFKNILIPKKRVNSNILNTTQKSKNT